MRKTFLFLALNFFYLIALGQQLAITGDVFEQKDDRTVGKVPFATISYLNYDDTTKVEFCTLSNRYGQYTINNLRNGKYKVKLQAPGYKTKWQEIQFQDVQKLAKNNNNKVGASITMERIDTTQILPVIYPVKDLIKSGDENIKEVIEHLKTLVSSSVKSKNRAKTYRILLGGNEIYADAYNQLNAAPVIEIAKALGDKNLSKTYIEFYNLSDDKYRTIVDGMFNIVLNDKNKTPSKEIPQIKETTDFFINQ